ncbi:mucin-2 [Toxorhynchites rutilus septentrionalis]|uniref:mucin-2 n=1 Tax=Toxorhynchites rutilus septentrionalis TaxID=329112 RepID=UPI002478700A|nr:mucin-2 [Toxorhynchites rutilus septentrionalis]XP_055635283.1 mucin-2 [Toxorhynchites rutilus septentrionalis]
MGKRNRHSPIGTTIYAILCVAALTKAINFDDDLEDLIAEESNMDDEVYGGYVLPSDVFNGGKPFFVERDPSTGAFDFNHKKTANQIDVDEKGSYGTKDSHVSDKKDVVLSQSSPNFHDFLNLPVKYTPSKFVYPLISSSYANLKYQGSNKVSNHKNFTVLASTTTTAPKAPSTRPQYPTTRQNTTRQQPNTTTALATPSSTRYTYPITSGRPITTTTTTTTTEIPSTPATVKQLFTRYPYKSTIKNKYLETSETRKKFFLPSTLSMPTITTTQKPQSTEPQTTPVRSSTFYSPSVRPWTSPKTTLQPTTPTETTTDSRPMNPIRFEDNDHQTPIEEDTTPKIKFTIPALKYEGNRPAPFRRLPSSHVQQINQKNQTSNKIELPKNPAMTMSLSDIFNTLGQDDGKETAKDRENTIVFETTIPQTTQHTTPPAIVLIQDQQPQFTGHTEVKIEQSIDQSDQYVNYEVQQSNGHRPQKPIDEQYVQYEVHQSNGYRPQNPTPAQKESNIGNQYVKYDVQQPQMNVVKFSSVPSMNSVVISPNQHSATFVLGSQQSVGSSSDGHFVGSVSQEAASAALNGHPSGYQMGQVLDEPKETSNVQVGTSVNVQVKPQDIIKTTSVRFPSESDDKYENAPIISGTHKSEVLPPNGHSAPIGMGSNQMVVFPKDDKIDSTLHEVSNRIVFDTPNNETPNQNDLSNYPSELPEQLTPPSNPETTQMQKRPRLPIPAQGPPFMYKEIQRRPFPGDRIRPPLKLPNILPQFRPNAKISHGHPNHHKEAGTLRVPPPLPSKNFLSNGPPLRTQHPERPSVHPQTLPSTLPIRRSPVPTRFMTQMYTGRPNSMPPPPGPYMDGSNENRRYYRLPPPMMKDRIFHITPPNLRPPPPPPASPATRFVDSYALPTPEKLVQTDKSTDTENNEFQRDPPTILKNAINEDKPQRPKLEPVVTLQMLQSKKQTSESQKHNLPSGQKVDLALEGHPPSTSLQGINADTKQSVYVVYPVKSTPMKMDTVQSSSSLDPVVIGHRGDHLPIHPSMVSPGTEYQNTPFSIASHFEQEPILMAKDKKHHQKVQFPYNLERPDPQALVEMENEFKHRRPEMSKENKLDNIYNIGEEPISKEQSEESVISSKLQRITESTPIAIAYTPTESNLKYKYNLQNSPYYSPYGETQTEVSYLKLDEFDEFGNPAHRYEQSFQAPFQASISLDPVKVTNPYEGWAVVTSPPQALVQEQKNIDRSDDSIYSGKNPVTIKPFDQGSGFHPELQGGFRPIYAEDVKLSESMNPDPQTRNSFLMPRDDEAQSKPEEHEKQTGSAMKGAQKTENKPLFDSLEAFFDNLTKDYDEQTELMALDGEENEIEKNTAKSAKEQEGRSNDSTATEVTTGDASKTEMALDKTATTEASVQKENQ